MVISEMGGADGVSSAEHETTLIKLKNKMLLFMNVIINSFLYVLDRHDLNSNTKLMKNTLKSPH